MGSFISDDVAVLHRAILENPFDDAPRYALADWYERNGQATRGESLFRAVFNRELRLGPLPGPFGGRAIFQRGMVEVVALNLNTFLVYGAQIFSEHPITHVEFLDLDPEVDFFGPGSWGWVTGHESPNNVDVDLAFIDDNVTMLPDQMTDEIEGREVTGPVFTGKVYTSKEDAIEALSRAAVRIGRKAAGLPPLVAAPMTVTT
jgi:uncharacterized protein (TIGR02996 family)